MENREFPRKKINIVLTYKTEKDSGRSRIKTFLLFSKRAKVIDISAGGMLIAVKEKIENKEKLDINFVLPETEIKVKAKITVIGIYKQEKGMYLLGVKFMDLQIEGDDYVKEMLGKFIKAKDERIIIESKKRILATFIEQEYIQSRIND